MTQAKLAAKSTTAPVSSARSRTKTAASRPRIFIVGASATIGAAVVQAFKVSGNDLILTAHRGLASMRQSQPDAQVIGLNLESDDSISRCAAALGTEPGIDVVIFLAGLLPGKNLMGYGVQQMDQAMAVNFTGQAKLLQKIIPAIRNGGQIIFTSSIAGERGSYDPIYAASKGAVIAFVKSMAKALAPRIRVNAVAPGLIHQSGMFRQMTPQQREGHRQDTLSGELMREEELAAILLDLTRPHWRPLNGVVLRLNGGAYV